jgi:hypothetical protein
VAKVWLWADEKGSLKKRVRLGLKPKTAWFGSVNDCSGNQWGGWKDIEKQKEEI